MARWAAGVVGLLLSGCTTTEAHHVPVRIEVAVDAPRLPEYVDGANAWHELGYFASYEASGLPECADVRDGLAGAECEVVLYVGRARVVEIYGARGITARDDYGRRVSLLDVRYEGLELVALAAHELGHSLLDTGEHADDPDAVMFRASWNWMVQRADRELACRTVGAGCAE